MVDNAEGYEVTLGLPGRQADGYERKFKAFSTFDCKIAIIITKAYYNHLMLGSLVVLDGGKAYVHKMISGKGKNGKLQYCIVVDMAEWRHQMFRI